MPYPNLDKKTRRKVEVAMAAKIESFDCDMKMLEVKIWADFASISQMTVAKVQKDLDCGSVCQKCFKMALKIDDVKYCLL